MVAYKFLRPGRVGPFSGVTWDPPDGATPGAWLGSGAAEPRLCRDGVHACRPRDLPLWIAEELWAIELRDPVRSGGVKLVASAGRLLAPVAAWDAEAACVFAADCTRRVRELAARSDDPALAGYADDAERLCLGGPADPERARAAAVAGLIAAHAAERAGTGAPAERERQAAWFAARLGHAGAA